MAEGRGWRADSESGAPQLLVGEYEGVLHAERAAVCTYSAPAANIFVSLNKLECIDKHLNGIQGSPSGILHQELLFYAT